LLEQFNTDDEKTIIQDLRVDVLKSNLNILILTRIKSKGPLSGYDLFVLLKDEYTVSISVGTIYAQLYALERKNLIAVRGKSAKARKFELTPKGAETTDILLASRKLILELVDSVFQG
jgi:DNA-binding PadR family transcriptional regulator